MALLAMLAWAVALASSASADHHYANYPERGDQILASEDVANFFVRISSNRCNQAEKDITSAIYDSTNGQSYWSPRWFRGLWMYQYRCDGASDLVQINIHYLDREQWCAKNRTSGGGCKTHGGENFSYKANAAQCRAMFYPYPCGTWRSDIDINAQKFFSFEYPRSKYRLHELMHETAHSMGLAHHCSGPSISNQGYSSCRWQGGEQYYETDRKGIWDMYPYHPYPRG